VTQPPLARKGCALAALPDRLALFGGASGSTPNDETWQLATPWLADFYQYGDGCPGTGGIPTLNVTDGALPWLASPWSLEVERLPQSTIGFLILGGSRTQFGSLPLPFDFGLMGARGCYAFTGPELVFPMQVHNGRVSMTFGVPSTQRLLIPGRFYVQAVIYDQQANSLGITTSNGGAARIGMR
jgi:hypothetical protein